MTDRANDQPVMIFLRRLATILFAVLIRRHNCLAARSKQLQRAELARLGIACIRR